MNVCCISVPALAVDGQVTVWGDHQEGRAGALAYTTDTRTQDYHIGQVLSLSEAGILRFGYGFMREDLSSRNGLNVTDVTRESHRPRLAFDYSSEHLKAGLVSTAFRRNDLRGSLGSTPRDERLRFESWLQWNWSMTSLDLRWNTTHSKRAQTNGESKSREHDLGLLARTHLSPSDQFTYQFQNSARANFNQNTRTSVYNNNLEYRGNHDFAQDKGKYQIQARANFFQQRNENIQDSSRQFVVPLIGAYLLDDTPGTIDPLEGDPIAEPTLHDNDRDTPTVVNIGDSAPVVREYGGDYRNIIFDFGEPAEFAEAVLYVDTQLRFPDLMQWLVYVSDEPEGRDWGQALPQTAYSAVYREWENGRQGWEITFAVPLRHRQLKLVNFKLGSTEPDIFITELEVYKPKANAVAATSSRAANYRLGASLGYQISPAVSVHYQGHLTAQKFAEDQQNLTLYSNLLGANWGRGSWSLAGSYQTSARRSPSNLDVDNNAQYLSLSRDSGSPLRYRLGYSRSSEDTYEYSRVTQNLNADLRYQFAPDLEFTQKVSRGLRQDNGSDEDSHSWVLSSGIKSSPRRSFTVNLTRTDRWVSQAAGIGFTQFNDSALDYQWRPLPLVAIFGQVRYQVREEDTLTNRIAASWSPLPGGSMDLQFSVNRYTDSRAESVQQGGGVSLAWRARPRLRLRSGVDYYYFKQAGSVNRPVNIHFRGSWSF